MASLRMLLSKVRALFRRGSLDREMDEELQAHLQLAIEEDQRRGMSATDARNAALRSFGGVTQIQEELRTSQGLRALENVLRDVLYTLRQMRKSPAFAATVIGTLALGIGAAAAMFTVVDRVLLRPVPFRDPGRLIQVSEVNYAGTPEWPLPWLDIEQWQQQSRSFQQIAFYTEESGRDYIESGHTALRVDDVEISPNTLPMLGVPPIAGRGLIPEQPSFAPGKNTGTIVLSAPVATGLFGEEKDAPGKVVRINGNPYTVVGVMPAGFRFPAGSSLEPQVWIPLQLGTNDNTRSRDAESYSVLARLRPGVTLAQAKSEMALVQKRIAAGYPSGDARLNHTSLQLEPYGATLVNADVRKALLALLAASGVLWLISAVNVTNLLLARAAARQREMAMRRALGASRWRLLQQMMIEGLVLSGGAAALGIALALGSVRLVAHELSHQLLLPVSAVPGTRILAALLAMTVVSAVLSTSWPALLALRAPIEPALKQGSQQAGTGRRQHRLRGMLVAAEVALSLTLLVACGLLLRTIYALRHVPLGYRTDHIVVANLDIPAFRYTGRNLTTDLYEPLLQRVQHLHGVQSAGLISQVPLGTTFEAMLTLRMNGKGTTTWMKAVTPDAQRVFGFRMVAGRFFDSHDTPTSEPAIVVNQTFARAYSPDQHNPAAILGRRLMATTRAGKGAGARFIGVLDDTHQFGIAFPSQPEIELCIPQITPDNAFYKAMDGIAMDLALRTDEPTSVIVPELRDLLRQASPELGAANITTMDQIVEDSYGSQRLAAHLLEVFGASALLLCVAGLYGLLAYVVAQRTRELGVRIALGAQRGDLLWLVMRQAGAMLLAGAAAGTGLVWASGRLVRGFLYGVKPQDAWTFGAATALLVASGLLAAYLPALRAARTNPLEALRAE